MCSFISWIEGDTKIYFLTGKQLFETERGKTLQEKFDRDDWWGHKALRWYYHLPEVGVNKECIDFSIPDNFPPKIANSIKNGEFRGFPFSDVLLNKTGITKKEVDAEWEKAYAEWKKAYAECEKADAEWKKADAEWKEAYAECEKAYAQREKADAQREKADAEWGWRIFADPKNRNPKWR